MKKISTNHRWPVSDAARLLSRSHQVVVVPELLTMTQIPKFSQPLSMRSVPRPSATPPSFHLLPALSARRKARNDELTKTDTSPHIRQRHQATVIRPMVISPSILAIHPSPKSTTPAAETLPPRFLGNVRIGRDSPSVRTGVPYQLLGIHPGQRLRAGGEASMICPLSCITLTGSILTLSYSMMPHV